MIIIKTVMKELTIIRDYVYKKAVIELSAELILKSITGLIKIKNPLLNV